MSASRGSVSRGSVSRGSVSREVCLGEGSSSRGVCMQVVSGEVGQTPPRTRKAGGIHPTGMLSCSECVHLVVVFMYVILCLN